MEFILNLALITTGFILALAYAKMRTEETVELIQEKYTDALTSIGSTRADLENTEKHLAHAISEIQILKGGMMENDELIDDLYEQGKRVSATVERLDQPKRKAGRIVNKLKKNHAASVKIKSPKDMVFHMTNTQKLSRRSK